MNPEIDYDILKNVKQAGKWRGISNAGSYEKELFALIEAEYLESDSDNIYTMIITLTPSGEARLAELAVIYEN